MGFKQDSAGGESVPDSVVRHYDAEAREYRDKVGKGLLGKMRDRELACVRAVVDELAVPASVLDVGSGTGFYSELLRDLGHEVTCLDVSSGMVEVCRSLGFEAIHGTVDAIPDDREFDAVLVMGSLEFNPEGWRPMLASSLRRVRAGGHAVVLYPHAGAWGWLYRTWHRRNGIAIRVFRQREIHDVVADAGLEVVRAERPSGLTRVLLARRPTSRSPSS